MKTGFLLAEDEAVKKRFQGITVEDDRNNAREVRVFYRYPEGETEKFYPFITIECIDVLHARGRQHSEVALFNDGPEGRWADMPNYFDYWPSEATTASAYGGALDTNTGYYETTEFIPVDILYQVSTYARSAAHDRQLSAQMLKRVIPFRWNALYVEADNTVRHFDLLDWTAADLLDPEAGYKKRTFRKIYTLQLTAELPPSEMVTARKVLSVHTTVTQE